MTGPIDNNSAPGAAKALPTGTASFPQGADSAEKKAEQIGQQALLPVQTDTTHCWKCKSKVGLLGFKCKCSYVFCSRHRHSDQHDCSFDYKAEHKQLLIKNNPKVEPSKVPPFS